METEIYQLIDQYLQNELSEDERRSFQQRLETEPTLAAALAFRQASVSYLKTRAGRAELEETMAALSKQYFGAERQKTKQQPLQRWLWPVAAAAACILLALMLWNPLQPDPYQRFAQHTPLNLTEKSTTAPGSSLAESSFNAGDYAGAYEPLKDFLRQQPNNRQAELALGIAAMETERYPEAAAIFTSLAEGESVYQTAGQWYRALLFVKEKQYAKAKEALAQIPTDDTTYGAKAKALLKALEKKE